MKKLLLTLIVSLAFCGAIFSQQYESHWPDFYYPNYSYETPFVAGITINGQIITADYEGWDALEVASFITNAEGEEECRGNNYWLINDYVEEYGDPFPILDGYPLYYTEGGDEAYFKMWDHINNVLYTDCTITYLGEPYTVYTGVFYDQGWDDPENPVWLNFTTGTTIFASAHPEEGGTITGAGPYEEGEVCTLFATANPGYSFLNWSENGTVVSSDAEYSFTVTGNKHLVANFYSDVFIVFADANVKALCVANWDTDGDGELSYAEAADVTDLGEVFRNSSITSFDELQYFISLTSIGYNAFRYCYNLTSIELPNSVTSIGNYAFYYCYNLTSIELPNSVTSIGYYAFYYCTSLTSIALPNSVTSIGYCAFYYCTSLTSIALPNSVTSIGNGAFGYCSGLTSIEIPGSVTYLDSNPFVGCSGLEYITVDSDNQRELQCHH